MGTKYEIDNSGNVTGASFAGAGGSLTSLNGTNVSSGTVADGRLTANVTLEGNSFNGTSQLVQLDGSGLMPALNGSALTSLNGTNISSGTVADGRLTTNVTLEGNSFNGVSQLVQLDGSGALPAIDGSALTNVGAGTVTDGTQTIGRLAKWSSTTDEIEDSVIREASSNIGIGAAPNNPLTVLGIIDASDKIGVGLTTPTEILHAQRVNDNANFLFQVFHTVAGARPSFEFYRAKATVLDPDAIDISTNLGQLTWRAQNVDATPGPSSQKTGAEIQVFSSEAWAVGAAGATMLFNTVATGATSTSQRMEIHGTGVVGMRDLSINNNFASADLASGSGVIAIHDRAAAPSGTPSAGGVLYVESGALKFKGSSGTVTTIANA